MNVSWSFFLYCSKGGAFFFAKLPDSQEPYPSLEEPLLGVFWICQALCLLGLPLALFCGWSSKLSQQREIWLGGDKAGKTDVMFFPHGSVVFRDLSTHCWSLPVSFGVGAKTETELVSKSGSCCVSPARRALEAIPVWERNERGGGEHLAFR